MPEPVATVLVIEDEHHMRRTLSSMLTHEGYETLEAASGAEGLTMCFARLPQLILLDLGLPDIDGIAVTRQIREGTETPIIIISARGDESDQIEALDSGANDYVTKPFREGELLARVRVAIRWARSPRGESDPFVGGELRVDPAARRVFMGGVEIDLTPTEYKLLLVLVRHAGQVVTHQQLLRDIWGPAYIKEVQYLRVYMKQLRYKLEKEPAQPQYLITAPGVGYRLKMEG
jgi:two-component system KDP operon response regulator KdpE